MKNILVVDDSATIRRMVMASLRPIVQTAFLEAANGLEAIERLAIGVVGHQVLYLCADYHRRQDAGRHHLRNC
jgi:two-component system chemotaxis response regulator CheY